MLRYSLVNMASTTDSTAKNEFQSVLHFLQVEGNSAAEIHRRMLQIFRENCVSDGVVQRMVPIV